MRHLNLNRRQAWKVLLVAFLSALQVEGWSPSNQNHGVSSFSSFLAPSVRKSIHPYLHSRQRTRSPYAVPLFSSASPAVNWEGNQTIQISNSNSNLSPAEDDQSKSETTTGDHANTPKTSGYDLGIGKNLPVGSDQVNTEEDADDKLHWYAPEPIRKPGMMMKQKNMEKTTNEEPTVSSSKTPSVDRRNRKGRTTRKMVARREEDQILRGALWHEDHFDDNPQAPNEHYVVAGEVKPTQGGVQDDTTTNHEEDENSPRQPALFYPDIDLSIPESVYSNSTDVVWDLMRWEAYQEAQREPLLVSFLYSSILNHDSLESSLAFLLANKISSPAMISTQVQSLVKEALQLDPSVGRVIRADIMAVRDRDPACTCLPDVFLYFKGFQALQTYRVANILWAKKGKTVLAHYLQSQMSQTFQIDIHPNATLGSGIMLDHGTGIVIGETARVGHNCSILHHVTLGGSGKKGVDRHPKIGQGVLLGAGASVIGNINIGDGCQVGAGTLVISDLPPHSVAVGVPAKIIGSFVDVTKQPSNVMNQMMDTGFTINPFQSEGI
ncbi:unnamed protein product [Cylindrotheca closterium]|uniref:serine O-acetyltransferase n=1 Tax=Cylindrotheca closterium TaxID=2856 RepID=A0AAD2JM21_9STRA|nr:unnamed protein product [Cylindrotheca closterium]